MRSVQSYVIPKKSLYRKPGIPECLKTLLDIENVLARPVLQVNDSARAALLSATTKSGDVHLMLYLESLFFTKQGGG